MARGDIATARARGQRGGGEPGASGAHVGGIAVDLPSSREEWTAVARACRTAHGGSGARWMAPIVHFDNAVVERWQQYVETATRAPAPTKGMHKELAAAYARGDASAPCCVRAKEGACGHPPELRPSWGSVGVPPRDGSEPARDVRVWAADAPGGGGSKLFFVGGVLAMMHRLATAPVAARCMYEVIAAGTPCAALYLDVDGDRRIPAVRDADPAVLCDAPRRAAVAVLAAHHLDLDAQWSVALDASTDAKVSQHVLVRPEGRCFANNRDVGRLVGTVDDALRGAGLEGKRLPTEGCAAVPDAPRATVIAQLLAWFRRDPDAHRGLFYDVRVWSAGDDASATHEVFPDDARGGCVVRTVATGAWEEHTEAAEAWTPPSGAAREVTGTWQVRCVVDESVYGRDRCFRLWGACKRGKSNHLKLVGADASLSAVAAARTFAATLVQEPSSAARAAERFDPDRLDVIFDRPPEEWTHCVGCGAEHCRVRLHRTKAGVERAADELGHTFFAAVEDPCKSGPVLWASFATQRCFLVWRRNVRPQHDGVHEARRGPTPDGRRFPSTFPLDVEVWMKADGSPLGAEDATREAFAELTSALELAVGAAFLVAYPERGAPQLAWTCSTGWNAAKSRWQLSGHGFPVTASGGAVLASADPADWRPLAKLVNRVVDIIAGGGVGGGGGRAFAPHDRELHAAVLRALEGVPPHALRHAERQLALYKPADGGGWADPEVCGASTIRAAGAVKRADWEAGNAAARAHTPLEDGTPLALLSTHVPTSAKVMLFDVRRAQRYLAAEPRARPAAPRPPRTTGSATDDLLAMEAALAELPSLANEREWRLKARFALREIADRCPALTEQCVDVLVRWAGPSKRAKYAREFPTLRTREGGVTVGTFVREAERRRSGFRDRLARRSGEGDRDGGEGCPRGERGRGGGDGGGGDGDGIGDGDGGSDGGRRSGSPEPQRTTMVATFVDRDVPKVLRMFTAEDGLYRRTFDDKIVRVAGRVDAGGRPYQAIMTVTASRMERAVEGKVRFVRAAPTKDIPDRVAPTRLHPNLIPSILEAPDELPPEAFRPLRGVRPFPLIHRDGTIFQGRGEYDPATQYLCTYDGPPLEVPEHPTEEQLRAAVALLGDLLVDFPMDDASCAVFFVALFTVLARQLFDGPSPLFAVEANRPGSGKGLLVAVISRILTGAACPVKTWDATESERKNALVSYLLPSPLMIVFDNVADTTVGGATIEAIATTGEFQGRLLHKNEAPVLPVSCLIVFTGNNMVYTKDMARRLLRVTLRASGRPQDRRPEEFAHANLERHVDAHRGELLTACFTVLRAFAGRAEAPPGDPFRLADAEAGALEAMGSFGGHAVIRRVVQWAFGADAVTTQRALVDEDADGSEAALAEVIVAWEKLCTLCGAPSLTVADALDALNRAADALDPEIARGFHRLGFPGKGTQGMGLALKKFTHQDTAIDGHECRLVALKKGRAGKVYQVQRGNGGEA